MFNWQQLIDMSTAEKLYNRDKSSIKRAIQKGKIKEGVDCQKFGRDWVFLKENMDKIYNVKG